MVSVFALEVDTVPYDTSFPKKGVAKRGVVSPLRSMPVTYCTAPA